MQEALGFGVFWEEERVPGLYIYIGGWTPWTPSCKMSGLQACSDKHFLALTSDGVVHSCGSRDPRKI